MISSMIGSFSQHLTKIQLTERGTAEAVMYRRSGYIVFSHRRGGLVREIRVPMAQTSEVGHIGAGRDHLVDSRVQQLAHISLRARVRVNGDVPDSPDDTNFSPIMSNVRREYADRGLELAVDRYDIVVLTGMMLSGLFRASAGA